MLLKRSPSLTEQVKAILKDNILKNEFTGGRIPSETELAETLGVSRTTVRDALSRLENEGVVYRKQGAGTFINVPGLQIKSRLEEIWSYEAVLEAHGYTPSTRVLSMETAVSDLEINAELNLETTDELVAIHKLFLEDAVPVIFTINYFPRRLLTTMPAATAFCRPVYTVLAENGREQLAYYLSEIVPVIADDHIARTLDMTPGTPLISFTEVGYNDNNDPILKSYSYFRDDLLRFRMIRRKSS